MGDDVNRLTNSGDAVLDCRRPRLFLCYNARGELAFWFHFARKLER